MAMQKNHSQVLLLDTLYCEEEKWEDEEEEEEEAKSEVFDSDENTPSLFPLLMLEQDLFWEDEELLSLFTKERQQQRQQNDSSSDAMIASLARKEAVEWILKVNAHYSFTALTAVLAVNYVDRFLSSLRFQRDNSNKPWMVQLVAVTCLSLAAKVEETHVPLLPDLQVNTKYVFEAKTIQRMELLVLSTLQWKMYAVTPLSFLEHIIRRLGLKTGLHWQFLKLCETLILSLIADSRCVGYYPSVLATATMMRVIDNVEPCYAIEYQTQLLSVLKLSKEEVDTCYSLISEISSSDNPHKRKINELVVPASPSGVIDAVFSSESSDESWTVGSTSSSVCSSPHEPLFKKSRAEDQNQKMGLASSLGHSVFVDVVGSPR